MTHRTAVATLLFTFLIISLDSGLLQSADDATVASSKVRAALVQSLRTNLNYCSDWIGAKDFKSLNQTTGQLPILVAAINRHTADSDRAKIDSLRKSVAALSAAAKSSDATAAKSATAEIKTAIDGAADAKLADSPAKLEKSPGGFGPLMALMDGTFADAKTAATVGEPAEAKQAALTLAELSQYLAIDRNDERWRKQSQELAAAASEAAASNTTEAKELRKIFHTVYDRCEACHAVRRPSSK